MTPSFFVLCVDNDAGGVAAQACGPFETRQEAIAELTINQQSPLERCHLSHTIVPAHLVPGDVACFAPTTTDLARRQQIAREAASRSSR